MLHYVQKKKSRLTANFLLERMQMRKQWSTIFKLLEGGKLNLEIPNDNIIKNIMK
jgi:hypothetical protein